MKKNLALVTCALALMACSRDEDYAGLSFDVQSSPPIPVSIESDRIKLVAGIAVKVEVEPLSDGDSYSSQDLVALRADDSDIFDVYAAESTREFVLVGLREGETCLSVRINRHEEECIEVRVLPAEE